MKHLAIDFGEKRIGLAVSDTNGRIAAPFDVFFRKNDNQIIEKLLETVKDQNIQKIVIGVPKLDKPKQTAQYRRINIFADTLEERLNIPLFRWDEGFSTKRVQNNAKNVDAKAAAIILQEFLDSQPQ